MRLQVARWYVSCLRQPSQAVLWARGKRHHASDTKVQEVAMDKPNAFRNLSNSLDNLIHLFNEQLELQEGPEIKLPRKDIEGLRNVAVSLREMFESMAQILDRISPPDEP